jgi:hypothetical protein
MLQRCAQSGDALRKRTYRTGRLSLQGLLKVKECARQALSLS